MSCPAIPSLVGIATLIVLFPTLPARTDPFLGEGIKSDMEALCKRKSGRRMDFEQFLVGAPIRDRDVPSAPVQFLTTRNASGEPLSRPTPVVATTEHNYEEGRSKIVGTAGTPPKSEPRATYEIRFTKPQRWTGLHRFGGDHVVTRFWTAQHELLHEFEGEGFVAWVANASETNRWVARVEISGTSGKHPYAGYADDLMFGQSTLSPSWAAKRAAVGTATTRHRLGLDDSRSTPGGTNSVENAASGPETGADAPDLSDALKNPTEP